MRLSKKVGIALSSLHLLTFVMFIIYLHLSTDGQSRLLWTLWLPFDFPVSMLVTLGFDVISSGTDIGSSIRFWLPYFIHGVIGTVWWFFVPLIISFLYRKFTRNIGLKGSNQ